MTARVKLKLLTDQLQRELRWRMHARLPEPALDSAIDLPHQELHLAISRLNLIAPGVIQLLGERELNYLATLNSVSIAKSIERALETGTRLLIITEGLFPAQLLVDQAIQHSIGVFSTPLDSEEALAITRRIVERALFPPLNLHGVFMDVLGLGVLLTGIHNIGKSELALELISRGHSLIADDAPEFTRTDARTILGTSPTLLREFLEVRGLGILNVRALFGDNAVKSQKTLKLFIQLRQISDRELENIDRLIGEMHKQIVLGVSIDTITLPVAPGRNLAVLVETAVRNYNLKLKGYDAAQEFIRKQSEFVRRDQE